MNPLFQTSVKTYSVKIGENFDLILQSQLSQQALERELKRQKMLTNGDKAT